MTIRAAARRLTVCLALACGLLLPASALAGENETIAVHILPGQYFRMVDSSTTGYAEIRLMAIIRNHGSENIVVTASSCLALGARSRAQVAEATGLGGHFCQMDPPLPWDLHPAQQRRIAFSWPVALPDKPATASSREVQHVRVVGLHVRRTALHGADDDTLRLVLTLQDGSEVRSEGFRLEPVVSEHRNMHYHLRMGPS